MYRSIYDLKEFYNTAQGQMIRRILRRRITAIWPQARDQKVLGIGFAQPYLDEFLTSGERCFAVTPARKGAHPWPEGRKNLTVLSEESELPFETNSLDRVLLIHSLEHAELVKSNLEEIWRVLKSNGRLMIIAPNRRGLWSRTDWSPFGQGTPYTLHQLRVMLSENLFVYERHQPVLFAPPVRRALLIRLSEGFEKIGPYLMPGMAGLYMIEASKQLYAGVNNAQGSKIKVRERGQLVPNPVTFGRNE